VVCIKQAQYKCLGTHGPTTTKWTNHQKEKKVIAKKEKKNCCLRRGEAKVGLEAGRKRERERERER
jgi:hypothetical protein